MPCNSPGRAWYSREVSEKTGRRQVTFDGRKAESYDAPFEVPCGKCSGCRADRSLVWSIRMHNEASLHEQNSFLTLTYADPPPNFINKRDLQLFFKRLRKHCDFRYFAVGEYGSMTHRPHYHAIIFGQDFLGNAIKTSETLYTNEMVQKEWGLGLVQIANASMASMCYVAGYTMKKRDDEDTFNLMSNRPGIGRKWLEQHYDDVRRTGSITIEGRELKVPPQYFVWENEELQTVKDAHRMYAMENAGRCKDRERRSREINLRSVVNSRPLKEKI